MPNRILRDWTDSERVNALSFPAEVFFVRLIMKADDYGRYHGSPQLLRSYLYPLRDVRAADITRWIAECVKAGLVVAYEVSGKQYIEIPRFGQRLRLRNDSKFPSPPDDCAANDGQMTVMCQSNDGQMTSRSEKREARSEKREQDSSCLFPLTSVTDDVRAADAGGVKQQKPEKIFFDYEGDLRLHGITPEQIGLWREQFPALDIEAELKAASAWLGGNPKNRKTDIRRFLTNWLIRNQDKAPTATAAIPRYGKAPVDYAAVEKRADRLAEELRRIGE